MHEAITLDRRELFKLCEVYGADWEQTDINGITPLMKAAGLNRQFYIDRLLEMGAKVDTTDPRGRNAAFYARLFNFNEVGEMLDDHIQEK